MLKGIGVSKGIEMGQVVFITEEDLSYDKDRVVNNTQKELEKYESAVKIFQVRTLEAKKNLEIKIGKKDADILEAHIMVIEDPAIMMEVKNLIHGGRCAEAAIEAVCNKYIQMFSMIEDDLMKQRIADIRDVRDQIIRILLKREELDLQEIPPNTILVMKELKPSMISKLNVENVNGILAEIGGRTSHAAILVNALDIPAVFGLSNVTSILRKNQTVIIDGLKGIVIQNPSIDQIKKYERSKKVLLEEKKLLSNFIDKRTVTADGLPIKLYGNIRTPQDAIKVINADGEGIGLFRTEFLFMNRTEAPTEDEQYGIYKEVLEIVQGKPVIIRTMDIGGDKEIPYLQGIKEENPYLGYRGIRFCFGNLEIFKIQLRALLRASKYGAVQLMVPFVSSVEEVRMVKDLLKSVQKELKQEGYEYDNNIPIGIMVETPASSLIADILAKEVDFFSIGTNDLTQYIMAADRGNEKVSYLYSVFHPAVLRSIKRIIECGKEAGIKVGMCGEAASNPLLLPLLLSFGLDEFSVNAPSILPTRKNISVWNKEEAAKLSEEVLNLETEKEIVKYLEETIKKLDKVSVSM